MDNQDSSVFYVNDYWQHPTYFLITIHQNLTQMMWNMKCAPRAPSQLTAGVM